MSKEIGSQGGYPVEGRRYAAEQTVKHHEDIRHVTDLLDDVFQSTNCDGGSRRLVNLEGTWCLEREFTFSDASGAGFGVTTIALRYAEGRAEKNYEIGITHSSIMEQSEPLETRYEITVYDDLDNTVSAFMRYLNLQSYKATGFHHMKRDDCDRLYTNLLALRFIA